MGTPRLRTRRVHEEIQRRRLIPCNANLHLTAPSTRQTGPIGLSAPLYLPFAPYPLPHFCPRLNTTLSPFLSPLPHAPRGQVKMCERSSPSEERSDPRRENLRARRPFFRRPPPSFLVPALFYKFCPRAEVSSRTRANEFTKERSAPRRDSALHQDTTTAAIINLAFASCVMNGAPPHLFPAFSYPPSY